MSRDLAWMKNSYFKLNSSKNKILLDIHGKHYEVLAELHPSFPLYNLITIFFGARIALFLAWMVYFVVIPELIECGEHSNPVIKIYLRNPQKQ